MWRSLFTAVGITSAVIGLECLLIDKAILVQGGNAASAMVSSKEFVPPEWAPWSLISVGAIVVIYSFTIPKRVAG